MTENRAQAFLWYSYFGYTKEKLDEMSDNEVRKVCAVRAYRDMNRTLRFARKGKHTGFRDKVCDSIIKWCEELVKDKSENDYNENHLKACLEIVTTANQQGMLNTAFTYGQAQKWLNMTMKYLWLTGRAEGTFLHIPIDKVIMQKLSKEFDIHFPRAKGGKRGLYSEEYTLPWSQWGDTDYTTVLKSIQDCEELKKFSPIEWEHTAWIE